MRRSPEVVFDPADCFPLRLRHRQLVEGQALGDGPRRLLPVHLQQAEASGSGKVEDGQNPVACGGGVAMLHLLERKASAGSFASHLSQGL